MIKFKSFSIFKSKQEEINPKHPTHRISAKIEDEYVSCGACWTKETKGGDKFLSCKMQDAYVDHTDNTKSRQSFVVIAEADLIELAKLAGVELPDEAVKPSQKPQNAPEQELEAF